jgi:hypothetical protein
MLILKNNFTHSQKTHLRGNKFKLVKPKSVSVRDSNFYVNRIVNIWNSLPDSIVTADSVFSFKRRLNSFDLHTMQVVFIFYYTALFSLALVLSNKQTNKQTNHA